MALKGTYELVVDFNDLDEHQHVIVYLGKKNAGKPVEAGQEVVLRDRGGASVRGVVLGRNGEDDVVVEAAWSTWSDPDSLRMDVPKVETVEQVMFYALVSTVGRFSGSDVTSGKKPRTRLKS